MIRACLLAMALGLLAVATTATAERAERFGAYELHFNAIPTGLLEPAVAADYGILRSRNRGLLMVTLLHEGEPVAAEAVATATDGEQPPQDIPLRQVREGEAVYYLGTFDIDDGERLTFQLRVSPRASTEGPFQASFQQRFHTP
jgi:hypothetical protein